MAAAIPFRTPSFELVASGLVALHRLIKDGKDDSPAAESVRDALDVPLKALNDREKKRAQWLSEDLYSVSEPTAAVTKPIHPQAQRQLNEAIEARKNREWDQALELLRIWKDYVLPAQLSYLRGSIWLEAGNPEVAAVFYGHASESDPENAIYRALYMHALQKSDPPFASKLARDVLADDACQAPVVVARAAEILINESRTTSDADAVQVRRDLIPVLERSLRRLDEDERAASRAAAYAMTVGLLGFCHEFLGGAAAAVEYYSRGIQADPNNVALLVARGIQQYGSSPRSISDFEQAVQLGSPVVWPYLFLAHHYLTTNQFEQCRVMCEDGLRVPGSEAVKSQLEQWRAIAQAELGFPPELVRAAFEAALRADPSNDEAVSNQAVFERALGAGHLPGRLSWAQKSVDAVRQLGMAERRSAIWKSSYAIAA